MPGYSGTPLPKKLGIKPGFRVRFESLPPEVRTELKEALASSEIVRGGKKPVDFVMVFHTIEARLVGGLRASQQATHSRRNAVGELAQEAAPEWPPILG